ncbi:MAG: lytic transglycosylase domain-containing protein [Halieaceae bacterium]|jgi:soluble lytic murein transglycosylase-like protein|nr:lytic transglycosylase domain-containing protein [Halieaceae bacterium]
MLGSIAQLLRGFLLILWVLAPGATAQEEASGEGRDALRSFLRENVNVDSGFEDRFDAEAWLLLMDARLERYVADRSERIALLGQIRAAAARSDLPPDLVLAVIEVESAFDRFAVSRVGAQGLMQVMPFWKEEIGRPDDNLTHNATNLEYGCRILQFYLQREGGALHRALAAYNGSSGSRVYSERVARAWDEHWRTEALDWSR